MILGTASLVSSTCFAITNTLQISYRSLVGATAVVVESEMDSETIIHHLQLFCAVWHSVAPPTDNVERPDFTFSDHIHFRRTADNHVDADS